jgi:hypothetical protein
VKNLKSLVTMELTFSLGVTFKVLSEIGFSMNDLVGFCMLINMH